MKLFPFVLLFSLLVFGQAVAATGSCDADRCQASVKTLYPHENGNVYVEVDANMNALDCTLNQGKYIVLEDDHLRHSEIYSMLLTAIVANRQMVVRITNGSSNCKLSYTQLYL